jgi:hypothetical protein
MMSEVFAYIAVYIWRQFYNINDNCILIDNI